MMLIGFLLLSFAVLLAAYMTIGRWLARIFRLSSTPDTPAHLRRDGLDFEPIRMSALFPQHFSAIAAAGPIVGPILAALYFGWGPAWIWIIVGCIFIGGIHDFMALLASLRHQGRTVAHLVQQYMNPRAYYLFLIFLYFSLLYVIIAFTDVTAGTFVPTPNAAGAAPGPAVATSSLAYLVLALAMGLTLRHTGLSPLMAKLVFLPLVALAIIGGPYLPLDLGPGSQQTWGLILLGYCFVASVMPVWLLLQPRGELGGYFLYIVMAIALGGLFVGGLVGDLAIQQPFFKSWTSPAPASLPLLPFLFITIACGACSGFHSIVASGTTSRQITCEADTRAIGYGAMLLEGFLACISLTTVMVLTGGDLAKLGKPDAIYANGIALFGAEPLKLLGIPAANVLPYLTQFALLCFATFVFDTLDACCRLARYVLMELLGWQGFMLSLVATAITLLLPVIVVLMPPPTLGGKAQPLWLVFWGIFGSSNQLLAALTLLGVTMWLRRRGYPVWLTLGPTIFMLIMTLWSLVFAINPYLELLQSGKPLEALIHLRFGITISLLFLGVWLVIEALIVWFGPAQRDPAPDTGAAVPAT